MGRRSFARYGVSASHHQVHAEVGRQLSAIVTGVDKQKVFVDGDDVCVIYDLKTAPVPSTRTCEWYRVRDGKVASVSVVFDARPLAPLFEAQGH